MWLGVLGNIVVSIPTLIMLLFCLPDLEVVLNSTYPNSFASYCEQLLGPTGAAAVLIIPWTDGAITMIVAFLSLQRVTYAIARDGILPGSKYFCRLTPNSKFPVNAGFLCTALSIAICATAIASSVAFNALSALATIAVNFSYLVPVIARHTTGRNMFRPAKWNLGRWSRPIAAVTTAYVSFLFVVLCLPQVYPVTAETCNYAPIMLAGIFAICLGSWFAPFGLGARVWFKGPQRTLSDADALREGGVLVP
ncbi:hypothetical protein AAFC00_002830 [Neodothiora populina]